MRRNVFLLGNTLLTCLLLLNAMGQNHAPITLDLLYGKYQFYPSSIEGLTSMADGEHYSQLEGNHLIVSYDYQTGRERSVILDVRTGSQGKIGFLDDYVFSQDEKKLLLITDRSPVYRHSFTAKHYIYDILDEEMKALSDHAYERLATFSPDGMKVAYVYENNLFTVDLVSGTETQVTWDGEKNRVINGAPDWVYEEEFGFTQAYCWSPDSKKLAFMRFDESRVRLYTLQIYNDLYPEEYTYKYPKAGELNSVVSVLVYDTSTGSTTAMDTGSETDQYIPRIKWTATSGYLGIIRLNRMQNNVDILLAASRDGNSKVVFNERNSRFISEIHDEYLHFTSDDRYFIVRSERTGYFHYYRYSMKGELINPVTQGDWDVDQVVGIDEEKSIMYYTSTEASPLQRQLYAVRLNGTGKKKLSDRSGTIEPLFSRTCRYYISVWSDANTPPETAIHSNDGKRVRILEDNTVLKSDMKRYGFAPKEFIQIPVSEKLLLNAYIIKPLDFDPGKKYPLLVNVYGGPESQDVLDAWDYDLPWQQMMVQQGFVVVCIDNRGTNGRGEEFRKSIYLQLGRLESEDQIRATRYLAGLDWIDAGRIGIWGWSYGGTMTLLCMEKGNGLYRSGVSVAPVTNWRFYDTIYTERFMRRPQDNPSGYDDNAPLQMAGELQGKLLLVHGTADDNVHLQNSLELADRLISMEKQFDMFLYPDRNHSIYGGNTRLHLYTKITDFLLKNL